MSRLATIAVVFSVFAAFSSAGAQSPPPGASAPLPVVTPPRKRRRRRFAPIATPPRVWTRAGASNFRPIWKSSSARRSTSSAGATDRRRAARDGFGAADNMLIAGNSYAATSPSRSNGRGIHRKFPRAHAGARSVSNTVASGPPIQDPVSR